MSSTPAVSLTVRDVMTAPAVTLSPDVPYAEIAHRFLSSDVGGMPVVDDAGRLLGVITEADLLYRQAYGSGSRLGGQSHRATGWESKVDALDAGDLMTANPITADLDDSLEVVARRLLEHAVSRLPVIRHGQVVGVVSRHDVLRRFARPDYEIAADIARAIVEAEGDTTNSATSSVVDGEVVLSGSVADAEDAEMLGIVAAGVDGAVSIDNQLVVEQPASAVIAAH
ncbi:MAG: hypothetical protein JWM34_1492 [Ilumatobacteraceae bacterium]|nr:hypothetical protein [Ilumatobacteraceae bacterium]